MDELRPRKPWIPETGQEGILFATRSSSFAPYEFRPLTAFLTTDGIRISFTDEGSGPRLLFMPAFAVAGRWWDRQTSALAPSYWRLTIDLRETGASDRVRQIWPTSETRGDDLQATAMLSSRR
jgi:hypothetical protein